MNPVANIAGRCADSLIGINTSCQLHGSHDPRRRERDLRPITAILSNGCRWPVVAQSASTNGCTTLSAESDRSLCWKISKGDVALMQSRLWKKVHTNEFENASLHTEMRPLFLMVTDSADSRNVPYLDCCYLLYLHQIH